MVVHHQGIHIRMFLPLLLNFLRMCDSCLAESGTKCDPSMHYKNFTPGAAWPLTMVTNDMYHNMPGVLSPWRHLPGWTLESTSFDFMHNLFLGTGRDLVASAIKVLIRQGIYSHVPATDMDSILAFLQEEMICDCSKWGCFG